MFESTVTISLKVSCRCERWPLITLFTNRGKTQWVVVLVWEKGCCPVGVVWVGDCSCCYGKHCGWWYEYGNEVVVNGMGLGLQLVL